MPKTAAELRTLIRDGRASNAPWQKRSKKNRLYWDGDSVNEADKAKLKERDQRPVVVNITKPACNLLIGMLAAVPMDYEAKPMVQLAKTMSVQATWGLKQIATLNDLDTLKRLAGSDAVVEGVGWLLSGAFVRDRNPELDPTQVAWIPARWVSFDLKATDPTLHNAAWMFMSTWWPIKQAKREWPKWADDLQGLKGEKLPAEGNTRQIEALYETGEPSALPLPYLWGDDEWSSDDKAKELSPRKDEVLIYEVYYRDAETRHYYRTTDGHIHPYDPETEIDKIFDAQAKGILEDFFTADDAPVIRRARMAGPFVLDDVSLGYDTYPLTPFFWDRDSDGAPYSFVQLIADQQEEVNAHRARAWWEVAGQRVQVGDEYLENHDETELDELQDNVARPDGVIKGSDVMPWPDNAGEHMAFVQMAKSEVQEAGAITPTMAGDEVGKSPRSAESKRISTVQAGMGFEAHRLSFILSFKKLGERLLRLMVDHHPSPWPVLVSDQLTGKDELHLILPEDVKYLIALTVGPASNTMREKYVETIVNMLPKLPPDAQLQAEGMLAALQAMDIPGVEVLEEALRNYIQRYQAAQQMAAQEQVDPTENIKINVPVDKLPPDVGGAILEKFLGISDPQKPQSPVLPASLDAAAQGAHRPRQERIGEDAAQAMTPIGMG